MKRIDVGDLAPDFTLPDSDGTAVNLNALRGQNVVVYFYPKDHSPGCTAQACSFRDAYERFLEVGARVIGISSDSGESHSGFRARHRLPFPLLSDAGGTVRRRYGVPATLGVLPGRVTYVIDADGIVRHVFNSQLDAARHVTEALRVLEALPVTLAR